MYLTECDDFKFYVCCIFNFLYFYELFCQQLINISIYTCIVYWLVLCQLDTGWSYHRESCFSWKMPPRVQLQGIFSISDQEGRSPYGWCHFWADSLGSIREQAEQARGGKPVSNISPWLLHQLLLPDLLEFQS